MSSMTKKDMEDLMKVPASDVREDAKKKAVKYRDIWLELGKVLYRVRMAKDYEDWGFETFEAYLNQELALEYREVMYWIQIIAKLVFKMGVDEDRLKKLPWSKVRTVLPVVTTKKNAEEWLDKVEKKDRAELQHAVRNKIEGRPEDEGPVLDTFSITVTGEQKKTILKAMEMATKLSQGNGDSPGHLLEMVAFHYIGNQPSNRREAFAEMVGKLEQVFHVKLLAVDKENPKWKEMFEQARDVIRGAQVEA